MKRFKHVETATVLSLAVALSLTATHSIADGDSAADLVKTLKAEASATFSGYSTAQLFVALQSRSVKWYEREALAGELATRPPAEVLPRLLPIGFTPRFNPTPEGPPQSFQATKSREWPVPMTFTAFWVWRQIVQTSPTRQKGIALLDLLKKDLPRDQKYMLLSAFTSQFIPETEAAMLRVIDCHDSTPRQCALAARALLKNQGKKHYELLIKKAQESSCDRKSALFKQLASRTVKRDQPDARVAQLGFEALCERIARDPSRPRRLHWIVADLEKYVNVKFFPYGEKEKYRWGDHGLTEAYFQKGVDNALEWRNKTKVKNSTLQSADKQKDDVGDSK